MRGLLILMILFVQASAAHDWSQSYLSVKSRVPKVFSEGVCSGALIEPTLVLTAWHCVSSLRTIYVQWPEEKDYVEAVVIGRDRENDLALLKMPHAIEKKPLVVLSEGSELREGIPVATIGHPFSLNANWLGDRLDADLTYVLSAGTISKSNKGFLLTDMSLSPGNSGGPVFDTQERIVGVVSRKRVEMAAGDVGYLGTYQQVHKLKKESEGDSPLHWRKADTRFLLRAVYISSSLFRDNDTRGDQWGLEANFHVWDRVRLAFASTQLGSDVGLGYYRVGYVHKWYWRPAQALELGLNYGRNQFTFSDLTTEASNLWSVGVGYMGIHLEVGQHMDFDEYETFAVLGIGFGG